MDFVETIDSWLRWLWNWIDWLWAGAWILAGVLATHLVWWRRHIRLAEREKEVQDELGRLGDRQREVRRQTEEMTRREGALKKMEENLRQQTEQLMPQIEQIRGWLDQVARRDTAAAAMGDRAGKKLSPVPADPERRNTTLN